MWTSSTSRILSLPRGLLLPLQSLLFSVYFSFKPLLLQHPDHSAFRQDGTPTCRVSNLASQTHPTRRVAQREHAGLRARVCKSTSETNEWRWPSALSQWLAESAFSSSTSKGGGGGRDFRADTERRAEMRTEPREKGGGSVSLAAHATPAHATPRPATPRTVTPHLAPNWSRWMASARVRPASGSAGLEVRCCRGCRPRGRLLCSALLVTSDLHDRFPRAHRYRYCYRYCYCYCQYHLPRAPANTTYLPGAHFCQQTADSWEGRDRDFPQLAVA